MYRSIDLDARASVRLYSFLVELPDWKASKNVTGTLCSVKKSAVPGVAKS